MSIKTIKKQSRFNELKQLYIAYSEDKNSVNIDWQELENLPEKLEQPAFFVTGSLDPVNFFVPSNKSLLERIEVNYENLLITKEIQDIGHWTQQESPDEVNRVILEFLNKI